MKTVQKTKLVKAVLLGTSVLLSMPTFAAGGLTLLEIGTSDVGYASAGYAARAADAGTVATNPAGMTRIKGQDAVLGAQYLYANLHFDADDNTTTSGGDGGNGIGGIAGGSAFYVTELPDDTRFGIGVFNNFGLKESWKDKWAGRYYGQTEELLGTTVAPSVAFNVTDKLSLGITANLMYGTLRTKLAINNIGENRPDGTLRYDDTAWGYGATLGALYQESAGTRYGITYTSETQLDFGAKAEVQNLGPIIDDVLTNRGALSNNLDLGVTVPQSVMTSVYHELDDRWAVVGNLGWQDWSDFGEVEVSINTQNPRDVTTQLGYTDTWHTAVGAQYKLSNDWQLSTGLSYDSSAVSNSQRSLIVPMGEAYALGLGALWKVSPGFDVNFAYEFKWAGDMNVYQDRGPLAGNVTGQYNSVNFNFYAVTLHWAY
jgi:long-chain fatty acid transport protein